MPQHLDLILTLTGGLAVALVFGFLSLRLKLSPIVGYLLGGVAIGPFTPGFVARTDVAEQLAEVGVILLMFGVGLHFHPRELLAVWRVAVPGAVVQIAIATALGVLVTSWFGWSLSAGIVFGLAIAVASTVVLLRVLSDFGVLHTRPGHIAVGWLLVEDLFTVLVLVLLPVFAGAGGTSGTGAALSILGALGKVAFLVAFTLVVGRRLIPMLLAHVARSRSRELFTLTVLVIALGIAVGSAKLFGASMALGAFLAGMVVGQSDFSTRAASEALPMRDAFAVLFFVSVGMLLDPASLLDNAGLIAGTLVVVLVGKPLAALLVVLLLGRPAKTAATVAIALSQIGEFSFILAVLGRQLGILPENATPVLVAVSIASITLSPLLFRLVDPLARLLPELRRPSGGVERPQTDEVALRRVVVVGYGPVGQTLVALLRDNGLHPTVVELNHETVQVLRQRGIDAVYGDASQHTVLEQAGINSAAGLVFAASGAPDAVVREATMLNPRLLVLTRTTYLREVPQLKSAGATVIVTAEAEVALAMTEHLLDELGATAEQLDRARDKVRHELFA
ncbi:MAG: cation:proton antiporter [Myxococcales bacterium]|nr:cation:proton antiporter [Myxococcales bacterium]